MKERTTQGLLTLIALLLAANLSRGSLPTPALAAPQGTTPDILRAKGLEIVDDQGRIRASIKLHPADPKVTMPNGKTLPETVLLRLITPEGRPKVKLGCSTQGSGLMVGGESDPTYARIMSDLGDPTLTLSDKTGHVKTIRP